MSNENKIPKIIHYCWFGKNPLPPSVVKCIDSWKKNMPGYEIKEWNESNYDINKVAYMKEAYEAKKYAFVSDYVRIDVLYHYGGLYFDTDVEIIRPFDDLLERGPFSGLESGTINGFIKSQKKHKKIKFAHSRIGFCLAVGVPKNFPFFKKILDVYQNLHFKKENGKLDTTNNNQIFARYLRFENVQKIDNIALCDGLYVYPKEYFCPLGYVSRRLKITDNTRSIHWYEATWLPKWIRNLNKFLTKPSYKKYEAFVNNKK